MEPYSGNAAIGYARLNVQGGQSRMYDHPWTREEVRSRPCVEGVGLGEGVDFLRGVWVEEVRMMVVTARSWDGREVEVGFVVRGLGVGRWGVYVDGGLVAEEGVGKKGGEVKVKVRVGREDVDVVVVGF